MRYDHEESSREYLDTLPPVVENECCRRHHEEITGWTLQRRHYPVLAEDYARRVVSDMLREIVGD